MWESPDGQASVGATGAQEVLWTQAIGVVLLFDRIMKIYSDWEKHAEDREILAKNKIIQRKSLRGGIGQGLGRPHLHNT